MSSPLISVIVPVYNRADVVARAVGSLLCQQFDKPYEIVVVDDGSSDDSARCVESLSSRVRVVRQPHRGAAAARRSGIEAAHGKFVAFLDSDDVAEPWHLQEHWNALWRRPGVVLSFAVTGGPVGKRTPVDRLDLDSDGIVADPMSVLIREGCITASMNLMTSRDVALRAAEPKYDVPAANDYAFALHVARQGAFAYVDRTTIRVDRRPDGIGMTRRAEQFGYALLAMHGGLKASKRTDAPLMLFRNRLADSWPSAMVAAITAGHVWLASRLLALGLHYGLRRDSPKRLWWAISDLADSYRS